MKVPLAGIVRATWPKPLPSVSADCHWLTCGACSELRTSPLKVAVQAVPLLPAATAMPAWAVEIMAIVWLLPTWIQLRSSSE